MAGQGGDARSNAPLRIALLGAGTVGREVVRGLLDPQGQLVEVYPALQLVGVAVRDIAKAVASGIPAELLTDAPAHLVASPDTDLIVEVMGGDEPSHMILKAALGAGKAVVTANKHVIAHYGEELEAAARASGTALRFEAAVGGGIPVLSPIATDLAANRFREIRGIVNGTTNFILSQMHEVGQSYEDALADAQEAGLAEADPSADVEGIDAANKLAILIRLAFGVWVDPDSIDRRPSLAGGGEGRPGITGVTAEDVADAKAAGGVIKLVARADHRKTRSGADNVVVASVVPTFVRALDTLARVSGTDNRVEIHGTPIGGIAFEGPGAGGRATSSAVLADILAIARGAGSTWGALRAASGMAQAVEAHSRETHEGPSGVRYPVSTS